MCASWSIFCASDCRSHKQETAHNIGLCYLYLKNYEKAVQYFQQANSIQRHDATFLQLGKTYTLQEQYKNAIEVYLEALE